MSKHTAGTHGAAAGPAALPGRIFPLEPRSPTAATPKRAPAAAALPCPALPRPLEGRGGGGGPGQRRTYLGPAGRGHGAAAPPPPFPPPAAAAAPASPPPRGASQPAAALRLHPPPAANAERPRRGVTAGAGNASPTPPPVPGRRGGVGAPPLRCPLPVPRAGGPPQAAFRAVCSLFCKACLFSSAASRIYTGTWAVFPCSV